MTANKNTFAATTAIRAGRGNRASAANYDPPHCPALNRLKRQRGKREEISPLLRLQGETIMTAGSNEPRPAKL